MLKGIRSVVVVWVQIGSSVDVLRALALLTWSAWWWVKNMVVGGSWWSIQRSIVFVIRDCSVGRGDSGSTIKVLCRLAR